MTTSPTDQLSRIDWDPKPGSALHLLMESLRLTKNEPHLSMLIKASLDEGMHPDQRFPRPYYVLGNECAPYWQPLIYGVITIGSMRLLDELIEAGADINCPESDGDTPLSWACELARNEMALRLLECGAKTNLGALHCHPFYLLKNQVQLKPLRDTLEKALFLTLDNPWEFLDQAPLFIPSLPLTKMSEKQLKTHPNLTPSAKAWVQCRDLKGKPLLNRLARLRPEEMEEAWPLRLKEVIHQAETPHFKKWIISQNWNQKGLDWALMLNATQTLGQLEGLQGAGEHLKILLKMGANPLFRSSNGLGVVHSLIDAAVNDAALDFFMGETESFLLGPMADRLAMVIEAGGVRDWKERNPAGFSPDSLINEFHIRLNDRLTQAIENKNHIQTQFKIK